MINKIISVSALVLSILLALTITLSMIVLDMRFKNDFVYKMSNVRNLVHVAAQQSDYVLIERFLGEADKEFGDAMDYLRSIGIFKLAENTHSAHFYNNLNVSRDLILEARVYCLENDSREKINYNLDTVMEQVCRLPYNKITFIPNDDTDVYYPTLVYLYQGWGTWLVFQSYVEIATIVIYIVYKEKKTKN